MPASETSDGLLGYGRAERSGTISVTRAVVHVALFDLINMQLSSRQNGAARQRQHCGGASESVRRVFFKLMLEKQCAPRVSRAGCFHTEVVLDKTKSIGCGQIGYIYVLYNLKRLAGRDSANPNSL
jgi:hypothetical protein